MSDTMRDALTEIAKAEQSTCYRDSTADIGLADFLAAASMLRHCGDIARPALAARPEASEGTSRFPREPKQAGGWTIQYNFLNDMKEQIEKSQSEDVPSLEEIEAVLLAVEAQAAPAPEQGERVLLEKLICVVNAVTAFHRHGSPIPKEKLDKLANTQIDIEEALRALLSRQSAEEAQRETKCDQCKARGMKCVYWPGGCAGDDIDPEPAERKPEVEE